MCILWYVSGHSSCNLVMNTCVHHVLLIQLQTNKLDTYESSCLLSVLHSIYNNNMLAYYTYKHSNMHINSITVRCIKVHVLQFIRNVCLWWYQFQFMTVHDREADCTLSELGIYHEYNWHYTDSAYSIRSCEPRCERLMPGLLMLSYYPPQLSANSPFWCPHVVLDRQPRRVTTQPAIKICCAMRGSCCI